MKAKFVSATFEVGGEIIVVGSEASDPTPEPIDLGIEYDRDGWSLEMLYDCCVSNERVDQFVAQLATGDQHQQAVAAGASRQFCVFVPGREYPEDVKRLIHRNRSQDASHHIFASGYISGMIFQEFYPEAVRDPGSRKVNWGEAQPGVLVPISGFDPHDNHETVADEYLKDLQLDVDARRRAELRGEGAPKVSPGGF